MFSGFAGLDQLKIISAVFSMIKPNSSLFSNTFAGIISGLMTVIASISYATLIFSGSSAAFLQLGIASALISATVIGCIVALRSSSPIAIAGPDANISAIIALIVAGVSARAAAVGYLADTFTLLWITLAACSLFTGVFLFFVGRFRLGRWIRFIPYPVVGGFLAGTGWLLLRGSFKVMCGIPFSFKTLSALVKPLTLIHWMPGLVFALLLLIVLRRWKHFLIMPSILIGAIIMTHIVLLLVGMPLSAAMHKGWLLSPFPADLFMHSFTSLHLHSINIALLAGNIADMAALMIVAVIVILLNAASVELTTRCDVELDRELITTGIANAIAAPFGALTGCTALSRTILNFKAGATSRVSGMASAVFCAVLLLIAAPALSMFPRPVLGGLLFYLGLSLVLEWVWDGWKRLSRFDYFLVIGIIIIIALWGFLPGVGIGLVVACMLFAINYSRTGVIKGVRSGDVFRSNVERSFDQQEALGKSGKGIYILNLQGYLFFGTAFPLLTHLRDRLRARELPQVRFVVLDFAEVAGLDSSTILSFSKLLQFAASRGVVVIFVNMKPVVQGLLEHGNCIASRGGTGAHVVQPERGIVFAELDYALQWCEERLLGDGDAGKPGVKGSFSDHLAILFPRPDLITRLLARLERLEVHSGFVLFEQGAPSTNLYFVETGSVTAFLQMPGSEARKRLRTMSEGTVIGEMGLYLGNTRSATIVADTDSVLYRLSAGAIERIEREDLELACALHRFFIRLLSKRLTHANEEIAMLGR